MLKEYCKNYFEAFSNKNIDLLDSMFSPNIVLKDWDIYAEGKSQVLEANKKIFDSLDSIDVSPVKLYEEGNVVVAELEILINKEEVIYVVDIIKYNKDNKIIGIRAYKG